MLRIIQLKALIASLQALLAIYLGMLAAQTPPTTPATYVPPVAYVTPPIVPNQTLGASTPTTTPTSTPLMCEYIVPGLGGITMSCAAIQACSIAHNCPTVSQL